MREITHSHDIQAAQGQHVQKLFSRHFCKSTNLTLLIIDTNSTPKPIPQVFNGGEVRTPLLLISEGSI